MDRMLWDKMLYMQYNILLIQHKIGLYNFINITIKCLLSTVSLSGVYIFFEESALINPYVAGIWTLINIASSIILATQDNFPYIRDLDSLKIMQSKLNDLYIKCVEKWFSVDSLSSEELRDFVLEMEKELIRFRAEYVSINIKCWDKTRKRIEREAIDYLEYTYGMEESDNE